MNTHSKIVLSLNRLAAQCLFLKESGHKLVLTSGCFDLIHSGHIEYIEEASSRGSLVVGINSDTFVRRLKGNSRPVRGEADRVRVMAAFGCVTLATVFDDDCDLIRAVKPDVYVASTLSTTRIRDDRSRMEMLTRFGSAVVELDSTKSESTTKIIARVNTLSAC